MNGRPPSPHRSVGVGALGQKEQGCGEVNRIIFNELEESTEN